MNKDVGSAFSKEPSSPYVAYLQDSERPLTCLMFILPVLIIYHAGIWLLHSFNQHLANGADIMLAEMLNLVYYGVLWIIQQFDPSAAASNSWALWFLRSFGSMFSFFLLCFVLLFKHHLDNNPWKIRLKTLVFMLLESILFSLPPFALEWSVKHVTMIASTGDGIDSWLAGVVLSMGAGVYEEFLFRMVLMTALFWFFNKVMKLTHARLYISAVLLQALLFAAFHYLPWSTDTFSLSVFAFRTVAGIYFAYIYQERGFGIAAGSHAIYDIIAVTVNYLYL